MFNTNNITIQNQLNYTWTIRNINKYSIAEFLSKLNYELEGNIFLDDDIDKYLTGFLILT